MQNAKLEEVKPNEVKFEWIVKPEFCLNGTLTIDEPMQIHVVKSGWSRPQMYHVLVEFGDMEQTDYHFMDSDQIKERFGVEVDLKTLDEMIKDHPNDMELGNTLRRHKNKN